MPNSPENHQQSLLFGLLTSRAQEAEAAQQQARTAFEAAQRAARVWAALSDATHTQYHARIIEVFTQNADFFALLRRAHDPAIPHLEQLYKRAHEELDNLTRDFASLFDSACRSEGVTLDSTSRHPRYSIAEFVQIQIDERKREATLSPRDGATEGIPLDPIMVARSAKRLVSRLFDRPVDSKKFLRGLRKAYRAVLKEEKRKPGDEVPLRRVANRLGKNWKGLAMDEFNIDLARIVKNGEMTIEGERMHLNHTRDTRQGILLYSLENGGYIGFISFKKEGTHA